MTINLSPLEVPADLEGAFAHARAKFKITDEAVIRDALVFALWRVIEGIPLEDSTLLESLESNHAIRSVLRERNTRTLLTLERALTDTLTLHRAIKGLASDSTPTE